MDSLPKYSLLENRAGDLENLLFMLVTDKRNVLIV